MEAKVGVNSSAVNTTHDYKLSSLATGGKVVPEDGWIAAGETWTYAASDDPTYTFTIDGDKTTKYSAGMRIKLTDSGTQYFIITKVAYVASTTVTVYGGTDYNLSGGAISSPYYSTQKAPYGFPLDPAVWTYEVTDTTQRTQSSPVAATVYNITQLNSTIPIGCWNIEIRFALEARRATAGQAVVYYHALSTANNSVTISSKFAGAINAFGDVDTGPLHSISNVVSIVDRLNITDKTSYYFNLQAQASNLTALILYNDVCTGVVRAICAYL